MLTASASGRDGAQRRAALGAWLPALVAIAIVCCVFGAVFWREAVGAFQVWIESTAYNHCFLVLPLVAFLLWGRRAIIVSLRPQPALWALALIPLLSALWAAGALLDILEVEQLVVVTLFEIILFAVLGRQVFGALLAPLLFLYFLVPFGEFLVPPLQSATTDMAVLGLHLFGIPVFADRFIIEIPEGTFEVAEACAGLRFLIASIVFGCFFATIIYRSPVRRLIFIALSFIVPILANGVRAFGIIAIAHVMGSATAVMTDHILYGWLFFSLVTLILIAIGMSFADNRVPEPPHAEPGRAAPRLRIGATAAAGLLLALLGPAYLSVLDRAAAATPVAAALSPPSDTAWVRQPDAAIAWLPVVGGAAAETVDTYRDGPVAVTRYEALYRLHARAGHFAATLANGEDAKAWRVARSAREQPVVDGVMVTVNSAELVRGAHRRLVWWFYIVDGRVAASRLEAKLLQARAILLDEGGSGGFIAISTELGDSAATARATLARFLQTMGPLRGSNPPWR